jgi:1-acyl-sn-glycerol-3-phosphate acyltransferase
MRPLDPCLRWKDRLDLRFVRALQPGVRALQWLHPTRVEGLEHLPRGGALLVGNHGLLGYETLLFFERLYARTGRMPLGLADQWFFRVPILRDVLVRVGGMYGAPALAHAALHRGELVVCYPGGAREALKHDPRARYRLCWEQSQGFIRVALRAGVPVVPFAGAGVDDTFAILSRLRGSGRWLMGHEKYDLPLLLGLGPLPAPVPIWFRLGRPIEFAHPPAAAEDPALIAKLHARVCRASQTLLDELVDEWRRAHPRGAGGPPRRALAALEARTGCGS